VSLDEIVDRLAIQDLISYSCHLQDTRNLHLLSSLYTPDATLDYGSIVMRGRAEIDAHYARLKDFTLGTSHTLSNPLVKIDGDSAVALHRLSAHHWYAQSGSDIEIRPADNIMIGAYHDTLQRTPTGWLIGTRVISAFGTGLGCGSALPPMDEMARAMVGKWPQWSL
jgi:hypothetical protein